MESTSLRSLTICQNIGVSEDLTGQRTMKVSLSRMVDVRSSTLNIRSLPRLLYRFIATVTPNQAAPDYGPYLETRSLMRWRGPLTLFKVLRLAERWFNRLGECRREFSVSDLPLSVALRSRVTLRSKAQAQPLAGEPERGGGR